MTILNYNNINNSSNNINNINMVAGRKKPMWKRRLENKIKELWQDLS